MDMGSGCDTGDIILQVEESILARDTAGSLHERLMVRGSELLQEIVRQSAEGRAPRIPQNHSLATFAF